MTVESRPRPGAMARAYVSLGANLGERAGHLGRARMGLAAREGIRLAACSSVVETAPVDVVEQPDFLNQVLALETTLEPRALLDACLAVERELGRDRAAGPRRGPRTIDVDVLLFDGSALDEPGLTIPHARLAQRPFFLALLREIGAPAGWIPVAEAG